MNPNMISSARPAHRNQVFEFIKSQKGEFTLAQVCDGCPAYTEMSVRAALSTFRTVLKKTGKGYGAKYLYTGR